MAKSIHPLHIIYRSIRTRPRMLTSLLFGIALALIVPADSALTHALIGWNAGALLFIALVFVMMVHTDAGSIRRQSMDEAEGRYTVLALIVTASIMVLTAIVLEILASGDLKGSTRAWHLALTMLTVVTAWTFVHLVFMIYYAHEYHAETKGRRGKTRGGLGFPGENTPGYGDFLYFALTVGMTAQTSDVAVQSRAMRRLVTIHSVISYVFTTAVIALTVNLGTQLIK